MTKGKSKDYVTTSVSGKGGQTNIPYRYPLVKDSDGLVINHPYTSTYLMPTCYTESVRKKVQTDAIDYDENTLIVISCIGAYLVGKETEGLMVILLFEIGKILEGRAISKSRKSKNHYYCFKRKIYGNCILDYWLWAV